ncbi:hypothetical protein NE237_000788 [Protea cynaroides]|uniref:Agenet domain-containing protein n=1 Tax=Protea cynaroides TaxID=273540 RepID=A0A9Q0KRV5_9MAGN|nr:hypothetical protein NE237_000788 [Protea cynaroides]
MVEICRDDEGFRGAWFAATVIDSPSNSSSKGKGPILMEYKTLLEDEGFKPLKDPPVHTDHSFELNEVVDAYHNGGWWRGVITKVFEESKFSISFPNSNEEFEFMKSDLRVHLQYIDGEWCPPENLVMEIEKVEGIGKEIVKVLKKRGRQPKKQVQIAKDQLTPKIDPPKVKGGGKETERVHKKRGRPPKKQIGDTSAFIKGQYQASREEKVDGVAEENFVSKESDMSIDGISTRSILEEQRLSTEQFYAPSNSSGDMPDNQHESQSKGAITWTIDQCNESIGWQGGTMLLSSSTVPTCNDVSVENQSLPFVKSLPNWKTLESMEIFHLLPQKPHFCPLNHYSEAVREGLAFGYMTAFANLMQKTSKLQLDNPGSDFEMILNGFVGLGTYGFNVQPVRERVNELLKIKDGQGTSMDKSKAVESYINKLKDENIRINKGTDDITENIKKVEETHRILREKRESTIS